MRVKDGGAVGVAERDSTTVQALINATRSATAVTGGSGNGEREYGRIFLVEQIWHESALK